MAKKNSTKTATKEALQAAEPRMQVFTGWQGINIKDASPKWSPLETGLRDHRQSDLKPNYLMVQNNLVTDDSMTIQTRPDSMQVAAAPENSKFTGVVHVHDRWIFAVVRYPYGDEPTFDTIHTVDPDGVFIEYIVYATIPTWGNMISNWTFIRLDDAEKGVDPANYEITEIGIYEEKFIALARHGVDDTQQTSKKYEGEMFIGDFKEKWSTKVEYDTGITRYEKGVSISYKNGSATVPNMLKSPTFIKDPSVGLDISSSDSSIIVSPTQTPESTERIDATYIYTNDVGMTLACPDHTTAWTTGMAVNYSSLGYMVFSGTLPDPGTADYPDWTDEMVDSITGVDVYISINNEQNKAFSGHAEIAPPEAGQHNAGKAWRVRYLGSLDDIDDWDLRDHDLPQENSTKGVPAAYFNIHDSKLYFWGNPDKPYRLYIGGAPGAELSIARGYGGGWIDIEPGSGLDIKGTAKWKTSQGANIVTIMCGNPNTGMVKRFNLVETNLMITNENGSKGYMYEEVSNVVGCNSRWGYGVYDDGLYSVSRYGLMLTTMAMEYNNQMKNQNVSNVIQPVFTDLLGSRLKDCRMVCIDSVIYLCLHQPSGNKLDQVILVYDIEKKAWYTFTHDETISNVEPDINEYGIPQDVSQDTDKIIHLFSLDSDEKPEGLGVITEQAIWLYPTAGRDQNRVAPSFDVLVETGEIAARMPIQGFHHLHQLELRFDYFIGTAQVTVEGEDYYGRAFKIEKTLDRANHPPDGTSSNVLYREYTEHIMVGMIVQSYRIRIKGKARFRLVSINAKVYVESNRIATMYGFDDHASYANRHGGRTDDHHYLDNYNNLIRGYDDLIDAIVT